MTDDRRPETPIERALKRRKKLQAIIQKAMQELEDIDKLVALTRRYSVDEDEKEGEKIEAAPPTMLSLAGHGNAQSVFERLVKDVLLEKGRPMRSSEITDALRERGQAIGGNETRTAWNRLWQAKNGGVLIHLPRFGYWLASEPVPENLNELEPPVRKKRTGPSQKERRGKKKGREPFLSDAQREEVLAMLARGMSGPRAAKQMGVSTAMIYWIKNKWRKEPQGGGENG